MSNQRFKEIIKRRVYGRFKKCSYFPVSMALNNVLYVDDEAQWRKRVQSHLRQKRIPIVDVAGNYDSGILKIKRKPYDLIITDGLNGDCFRLIEDVKGVTHGPIVIFSADMGVASQAKKLGIPYYTKLQMPQNLDKIVAAYKKNI